MMIVAMVFSMTKIRVPSQALIRTEGVGSTSQSLKWEERMSHAFFHEVSKILRGRGCRVTAGGGIYPKGIHLMALATNSGA